MPILALYVGVSPPMQISSGTRAQHVVTSPPTLPHPTFLNRNGWPHYDVSSPCPHCTRHTTVLSPRPTAMCLSPLDANPSSAWKPQHLRYSSFSKRPLSPPTREQTDATHPKKPQSFQNDAQTNGFVGPPPYNPPIVLPICAICLRHHRHSMPVIQCPARRTWDDKYDTYCERVNKAIHIRNSGATLCSLWQ